MFTYCEYARAKKKKFLILAPLLSTVQVAISQKADIQIEEKPKSSVVTPQEPVRIIEKSAAPTGITKKPSKFSITAAFEKSEEAPETAVTQSKKELPSQHFTETDLQGEWRKFLQELQERDVLVFNAISSFKFNKKNEDIVKVTYPSESAKFEFEKIRAEFFNHFMHKVNHFNIVIEYQLDVTMKKEIMTKRKIFDKFAEINPILKDLDDLFKLDFN